MLEDILAKNPKLAEFIDVSYVGFEKARQEIIAIIGEENQSLPVLILPEGISSNYQNGVYNNASYISDLNDIMMFLSETYNLAKKHP